MQAPCVHLNFGMLDVDFGNDGVVVVRCVEGNTVTAWTVHRVKGGEWRFDQNTVSVDDLPCYPSVMSH